MINIKIEPRTDTKRTDKLFQLRIKVGTGSDRKFIALPPIVGDPADWDKTTQTFRITKRASTLNSKERNKHYEKNNIALGEVKKKCNDILIDFARAKQTPTATQFVEQYVENRSNAKVGEYFDNHIKNLRETGHIGTANSYEGAVKMLRLFDPKFNKRYFADINLPFVEAFDRWLQKRDCNGNSRRNYHASLRAIFNKAIKAKAAIEQTYPYGKNGFSVNSLAQKTTKRYLPKDAIKIVRTTEIENYTLEQARRIFIAQYLCFGISFIDAAALKKTDILTLNDGQYIVYKRQKTESAKSATSIKIKITPELQEHLAWFEDNCTLIDDYLFPIVSIAGYEGEQLYNHTKNRLRRINKTLKKLATHFGIENLSLSTYVSRHSFAMTLSKNTSIKFEQIQQAMGHADPATTMIYLEELNAEEMAGVAEALTDF